MIPTRIHWKDLKVAPDQTHHVVNDQPAYPTKFSSVMKFHEPGFAPVQDKTGAFHIDVDGHAAYSHRFLKTFGFYQERAAVESNCGWHHIKTDGSPLYLERYKWCGNYQELHVVVKNKQGMFFYLDHTGKRKSRQTFRYAGDYCDGYAVIQNDAGFHTHIDTDESQIHKQWFLDLDVFHKNYARAKDKGGWFHITRQGLPLYAQRYLQIEPFYNGISRVEAYGGSLLLINEQGETTQILREQHIS